MAALPLAFALALLAISYSPKETNGEITAIQLEIHTTVYFPCGCLICPGSEIALVQWYISTKSDTFIKDGKAIAWWTGGANGTSPGYGIKDDFSMMIYNLTDQHNNKLYRCIVSPVGGADACTYDVKLEIYAKQETAPVIEYIQETNGLNLTCSIRNVFPVAFPILTTKEGSGIGNMNREIKKNTDGTYNTAVTHLFPANEKDTTIQCLYSNFNFKGMSSLRLEVGSYTIDQPEEENGMENNMTSTDVRCTPSGSWMVWIILTIGVSSLIVIVYATKSGREIFDPALGKALGNRGEDRDRDQVRGESNEEEEPPKSTKIRPFFGKLSWAVITLTIQMTIVVIISVANLATARCLVQAE